MKIARALFIASYRLSHACLGMQFDHYLKNIDQTYIFTDCEPAFIDGVLQRYGIDTSKFVYVQDREMDALYPTLRNWWFDGDHRGSWLYQQALKMASLDYIDADVIMIQDPDTFCIEPYHLIVDGKPNYFILPNERHTDGYYQVLENCLGIERQTEHCFVSEFMPMFKEDWLSLKHSAESRNNKNVFDAIIDAVPIEPYDGLRWFSEYEFLANWTMTQRPIEMTVQRRFQYKTLADIGLLSRDYNCACDAIPKLADSIVLDFNTGIVTDFDKIFDQVKKFL